MKFHLYTGALVTILSLAGVAAQAKAPEDGYCSFVSETEDGKFTYQMKMGWSLIRAQSEAGEISYPEKVVAVSCMRDPTFLAPGDEETLRQGIKIFLADPATGVIVTYEVVDGKIQHDATAETLGKSQFGKLEKASKAVEALL